MGWDWDWVGMREGGEGCTDIELTVPQFQFHSFRALTVPILHRATVSCYRAHSRLNPVNPTVAVFCVGHATMRMSPATAVIGISNVYYLACEWSPRDCQPINPNYQENRLLGVL